MSKECQECEYFEGFDCDGVPECSCKGGFDNCPFNDELPVVESPFQITIDTTRLTDYISHTISNTVANKTRKIINNQIKSIVTDTYKEEIEKITKKAISSIVDQKIAEFMAGDITIGGGWSEPQRTISREQYLSEVVENELNKRFGSGKIPATIKDDAIEKIERFTNSLRRDINRSIGDLFNKATREALTDNVVNMLMANDTFKKLSDSMNHLLPETKE